MNFKNWNGPWIAKTQEGWLVNDGRQNLELVPEIERQIQKGTVNLPPDWWKFAAVVDSSQRVVKEPEWPRNDQERIVHGGPQILSPQKTA